MFLMSGAQRASRRSLPWHLIGTISLVALLSVGSALPSPSTAVVTGASTTTLRLANVVRGGPALPSAWTLKATGITGSFSGPGPVVGPSAVMAGALYSLSETGGPSSGYIRSAWACIDPMGAPVSFTGLTVVLQFGQNATCTITNTYTGTPVPSPTPTPRPSATPVPTPRPSATPVPTPRPSASPAPTPRPSATPVPTPRPSATPMPTPRPSATPTPPSGGSALYGPGIGSDSLGNQQVGGTAGGAPNTEVAYRFRATESSALTSIRVYIIGPGHPGYAGGTGGTFRVTVQADDGTAGHFPSGTVLATQTITPVDGVGLVITFPSPATLVAGRLYHVVFTNIDPSPTVNFASVDGLYDFAPTTPMQPSMADDDWGQSVRFQPNAWEAQRKLTPIMALTYANGRTAGVGYMEVWPYTYQDISGVATARERFTVSGATRTVSSVGLRLMRVTGTSPLTIRLETASGVLVAETSVPASAVPVGVPGTTTPTWASAALLAALASGQGYNLVLSAPAGTTYSVFAIRGGSSYGYPSATYFADGVAQYNDGAGWEYFGYGMTHIDEGDLQFYLR